MFAVPHGRSSPDVAVEVGEVPGGRGAGHRLRLGVGLLLLVAVSGASAWWHAFSSIRTYDDEGTLMLSVQRFLDGRVLYDSLLSNYGPTLYLYQSLPLLIDGTPVSHDSVRMVSAVLRVLAGLAVFALVSRVTGSLLWGLAAHVAGFRVLAFVGTEAAHPQELCILLLFAVALASTLQRGDLRTACFGALAAAGLLTKINFGLLVVAAVVVVAALAHRRTTLAVLALALPPFLMRAHLLEPWGARFATLMVLSLTSALLVAGRCPGERVSLRDGMTAVGLAAVTWIAIASFVLRRGTTPSGMFQSLVVWPATRFAENWSMPLPIPPLALLWAAGGLVTAWLASRRPGWVAPLKLGLGALVALGVAGFVSYAQVLWAATPMLWLVAANGSGGSDRSRPMLAVLGVLQVLYAYPVAGAQTDFTVVMIVAIAAICFWDASPGLPKGLLTAAAILIAGLHVFVAARAFLRYQALEPLGLPGAQRLRVDPALGDALRRITAAADACSMIVTEPGLYSFNLFTRRPAPSNLRSGPWMLFLSDAEQQAAVRELEAHPDACAVMHPEVERAWTRGPAPPERALVRYVRENFRVAFEVGGYRFLVRR